MIHQKVDNVIGKFKGQMILRDDLGISDLAYTIGKEKSGRLCVVNYTGVGGVVEEIERHFRISDVVIRFMTVSVDNDYDYNKVKKQIQVSEEEQRKGREFREQRRGGGGGRGYA